MQRIEQVKTLERKGSAKHRTEDNDYPKAGGEEGPFQVPWLLALQERGSRTPGASWRRNAAPLMKCSPPKHEAESDPAPGLTTDWQEILGTEQHIRDAWGFDLRSQPLCEPPGFSNIRGDSKGEKGEGDMSRGKRQKHTSMGPVLDPESNRLRKKEGKKRKKEELFIYKGSSLDNKKYQSNLKDTFNFYCTLSIAQYFGTL